MFGSVFGSPLDWFGGLKVVEVPDHHRIVEDWSECRSPSRARRRWKQRGIAGHLRYVAKPLDPVMIGDRLIIHPSTRPILDAVLDRVAKRLG